MQYQQENQTLLGERSSKSIKIAKNDIRGSSKSIPVPFDTTLKKNIKTENLNEPEFKNFKQIQLRNTSPQLQYTQAKVRSVKTPNTITNDPEKRQLQETIESQQKMIMDMKKELRDKKYIYSEFSNRNNFSKSSNNKPLYIRSKKEFISGDSVSLGDENFQENKSRQSFRRNKCKTSRRSLGNKDVRGAYYTRGPKKVTDKPEWKKIKDSLNSSVSPKRNSKRLRAKRVSTPAGGRFTNKRASIRSQNSKKPYSQIRKISKALQRETTHEKLKKFLFGVKELVEASMYDMEPCNKQKFRKKREKGIRLVGDSLKANKKIRKKRKRKAQRGFDVVKALNKLSIFN